MAKENGTSEIRLEVMVFTDPYCSWCWAAEPMLLSMAETYREQLRFIHVLGGLIKDMDDFLDPENGIAGAAAVMPHWRKVSGFSGQPVDERLWEEIAGIRHFSSWPASIACRAAFLQGEEAGVRFLRNMRIAALTGRKVISEESAYNEVARQTEGLDFEGFREAVESGAAAGAFEEDRKLCERLNVHVFPTLLFYRPEAGSGGMENRPSLRIEGYYTRRDWERAAETLAPRVRKYPPRDEKELLKQYGPLTDREISEITGRSKEETEALLEKMAEKGEIRKTEKPGGSLWRLPGGRL